MVKDAELFALHDSGEEAASEERGFADVWKKDCFAWEYKGKKKNLDEAYRQLLRYRESLLKPPSFRDPDTTRSGRPAPLRHGETGRLWAPALLSMLLFSLVVIGLVSAQDDSFGWLT